MKKCHLSYSLLIWLLPVLHAQTQVDLRTQSKSVDLSGAAFTIPARTGTALPTTCMVGEFFFKTNAPTGQNIYGCAPANTWTLQAGASVASTTNLLAGDNLGNAINTGISPTVLVTLTGVQTLTNKSISSSQITGLAPSATVDSTNASNINSGTLSSSRLPAPTVSALGGVQAVSPVSHNFLTGIAATGAPTLAQPSVSDVSGYVAPVNPDWNLSSGLGQVLNKPTKLSSFTNDTSFITSSSLASTPLTGDVTGTAGANTVTKVNGASLPSAQPCVGTNTNGQIVTGTCGGGAGATIAAVTNLIAGSGSGNGVDSGISPSNVATVNGTQTLTNKSIAASQITGVLGTTAGGTGTTTPSLVAGSNVSVSGTWPNQTVSSSPAFSGLSSSTNTSAALVVGTGASLAASGTGTIAATSVPASGVTGVLGTTAGGTGTTTPSLVAGSNVSVTGTWPNQTVSSSTAFSGLSSSTNTSAALVVGTGASLAATGTGTIAATSVPASGVTGVLGTTGGGTGTATPSLVAGPNVSVTGTWPNQTVSSSPSFSGLSSSTNTSAALVVGTGASLAATGTGTIAATSVPASGVSGVLPIANGGTGTTAGVPVQSVAGRTGAITLSTSDVSGYVAPMNADWNATSGLAQILNKPTVNNAATVNGGAVPASQTCVGSNSSSQLVAGNCLSSSNNLSDIASASTARTNLGLGSAATQASTAFDASGAAATVQATSLQKANNLSDLANSTTARTNLGLGTAATQASTAFDASGAAAAAQAAGLQKSNNLSDVASVTTARTNLGLGTAATQASTAFDAAGAASTVQTASLQKSSNLSDLASASTARTNLGLTGAATATLPLSVANGGTGTGSASLVGGSNISITGSWPNQTVAATVPTVASTANLLAGDGSGNASGSGIAPSSVVTLTGTQTLTNKSISAGQISGLAASATTDATNASNIGSGTLAAARLPNPTASTLGGTQSLAPVAHNFMIGISTSGVPSAAQPSFSDISGVLSLAAGGTGTASPSLVAGTNVTISGAWPNQTISASGGGSGGGTGLNPPASGSGLLKGSSGGYSTTIASAGIDYQSPTSISAAAYGDGATNGIQSAVAACGSTISCSVVAPPSYGTSENRPCYWGNVGQPYPTNGCSYSMTPNITYFDFRNGIYAQNADSGGVSPTTNYQAWNRLDFITTQQMPLNNPGLYFTSKVVSNINLLALGGGTNTNTGTYPNKAFYVGTDTRLHGYTGGQKIGYQSFVNSYAVGDALGFYGINTCYGGFNAASDEGCEAMDIQATQGTVEYTGTVASTSGSTVTVSASAGEGTQGEGRFMVDASKAITAGTISAIGTTGPLTLTGSGTSWPVSTVNTTLNTAINSPGTATVSVASGAGISTSTTLCVADPYELEQVVPTAVSGTSFTAYFRYPHSAGAYVTAGGLACHFLSLNADMATNSTFTTLAYTLQNSLHWVVPIIRSTSSTSLDLWLQSPNSGWEGYRGRWTAANGGYAIYPGAQVTSVMQNQKLSSTITLEVPVGFSNGDGVFIPLYHNLNVYEALHGVQRVFPQVGGGNPAAWWMTLNGLWTDTDTAMEVDNNTPASVYTGGKSKPLFMHPRGSWDSILYFDAQPSNMIRSEDSTTATNIMLQSSALGYAYIASDPLNYRWSMGNYFNSSYILFDWQAGNIQTTGKIYASAYVTQEIETGKTTNTDLAGFITLSSGSGSYTFTGGYANAPVCTANDNTSVAAVRVQTTASTLTVTGTGSDVISYVCVARF